jgi:hypothetical protein
MKHGINLWLDDKRDPKLHSPHVKWVWVKTAPAAIEALKTGSVEHISLDHDLGLLPEEGSGYEVAVWIEEVAYLKSIPKLTWYVHSANPVGKKRMEAALRNADQYFKETL